MNIFYVDSDASIAAKSLVDKHVIKQILESAQLLSTAHRVLDGVETKQVTDAGRSVKRYALNDSRHQVMYAATHQNHPSAVWCRSSIQNYEWLVEHFFSLCDEYKYRYEKTHKCFEMGFMLQSPPLNLKNYDWTKMPSCMDSQYIISDDPIINYRNYYRIGKKSMHSWKNRQPPEWI